MTITAGNGFFSDKGYMERYTQEELLFEFQKSIDEQKEKKN